MSEVVARILRAAGHVGPPPLQVVALALDPRRGAALVSRLSALGVTASLASDEAMAIDLVSGESEYNALVVDTSVPRDRLDELTAAITAKRPATASLAVIHLAQGAGTVAQQAASRPMHTVVQSVAEQELAAALEGVSRSVALVAADVQRQVEIIARAVIRLGQRLQTINNDSPEPRPAAALDDKVADQAAPLGNAEAIESLRRLIRSRRLRERFFEDARFGEPAWDIMLDLSLAWFEGKAVSVSSVCIASGVPTSTAMRWINEMIDAGLVDRWIDPTDGRRNLVQITPATRQAMLRYLAALKNSERASGAAATDSDAPPAR